MLANLCAVPGVRGAALFDPQGGCVESQLVPPYEPEYIFDVAQRVMVSFEAMAFIDANPVKLMLARLSEGAFAIMNNPRFILAAMADRTVNPMMLNVALGALESRLAKLPHIAPPQPVSSPASLVPPSASMPRMSNASLASSPSLVSVSDFTLDASQLRQQPVPDAVSVDTMRGLIKIMSRYVGPMSKHVLKRELKRMGRSSTTLPRAEWGTLVERVGAKIERSDLRSAFLAQAGSLSV